MGWRWSEKRPPPKVARVSRSQYLEVLPEEAIVQLDRMAAVGTLVSSHLMQERLLQSEKMASIGQLVSGVAHELNNPLTGVIGFAQLLLARDLDEQTRRDVEIIYSEAERAAKIVENLLSFGRRRKAQKGLIDLNTLLQRVLELRSYDLRVKNIELELDLDPGLPRTMSDPDQIQQVFFNIVTNAEHAMLSAHGKGKLKVRSRADKGYVRLSFIDDGVGIPPENLRRVFDPFFTTKEGGQGTGLGLTISYGIVDDHGGRIRVESRPAKGATFVVELPIVEGPKLPPPEREAERSARVEIGSRVLVVDDEENILELLRNVLTSDGHRVDTARSGDEALALLAEHGYDLLITDIKMPGMSGQALYQRVKEMDSELAQHTLFITGDTVSAETRSFLQRVDNPCLAKPFRMREVREAVDSLFSRPDPTPHESEAEKTGAPGITGRILVVDDEDVILTLLRSTLAADGHTVDTARTGIEALERIETYHYDALVLDIKLPGMSGPELHKRLWELDPRLARRTIFITGHLASPEVRRFTAQLRNPYLAKPLQMTEVREVVLRVLADGA